MDVESQVNKLISSKSGVDDWLDYITKLKENHTDPTLLIQVYTYAVNTLTEEPTVGYKKILIGLANLQSGYSVEKARELYLDAKGVDYDCAVVRVYHAQFEYLLQNKMGALEILTHAKKAGCEPRSLIKKAFQNCRKNEPSLFRGVADPWDNALSDETGGDTQNTFPCEIREEMPANSTVQKHVEPRLKLISGPVRSEKKIKKASCVTPRTKGRFKRSILCDHDSHSEVIQRRGPTMSPFTKTKYSPLVKRGGDNDINMTDSLFSNLFPSSCSRTIFEVSIAHKTPLAASSKAQGNLSAEKDDAYGSGSSNSSAIPTRDVLREMLLSSCSFSPYQQNINNANASTKSGASASDLSDSGQYDSNTGSGNKGYDNIPEGSIVATSDVDPESLKNCNLVDSKDSHTEASKSSSSSSSSSGSSILCGKQCKSNTNDHMVSMDKSLTPKTDFIASSTGHIDSNNRCASSQVTCKTESYSNHSGNGTRGNKTDERNSKETRCRNTNSNTSINKDVSLKINIGKRLDSSDSEKDKLGTELNAKEKSNESVKIALRNDVNIPEVIKTNIDHFNVNKENANPNKEHGKLYCVKNVYYEKVKEIGMGGSCKVFEVLTDDGATFALKKVNLSDIGDTILSMYRNEITFLEKMKGDKHIIKLHDWEFVNQNLFLVLEKGDYDLSYLLKKKKAFSKEEMKKYWQQMVEAVKTIHENGIVHADLKPANFLLVGNMLKLIDFGIANGIQDNKTSATRLCQMGTLNYMSPEVLDQDSCRISKATDIWSLGCILYYMVYKKTPYSHIKNQYSRSIALQSGAEINFKGIDDLLLKKCLQGCLKYKKEERYTIQQLLEHPYLS